MVAAFCARVDRIALRDWIDWFMQSRSHSCGGVEANSDEAACSLVITTRLDRRNLPDSLS